MTVALIAGTGGVPPHVAKSLMEQGRVPIICEMRGFPSDVQGEFQRIPFRMETLGTFLATLKKLDVTQVCMVGVMHRPTIDPTVIDAATAPLVSRLMDAMAKGDDGTLRGIIAIFEEHGFTVIGAHQFSPDLLPNAGVHTDVTPPDLTQSLSAARTALADMGLADEGQAMLVRDGAVIAREDARGTAAMLQDFATPYDTGGGAGDPLSAAFDMVSDLVGDAADWLSGTTGAAATGAVLFKAPKPNQILQADMPFIGPDTAKQAVRAGLAGIVVPVGQVMVMDLAQVVSILNAHGMFFWVMERSP